MDISVINTDSNEASKLAVSDAVFGRDYNVALVHQVITAYQAAGRSGSAKQKSRAEVHGAGKKRWRQKGTGNARVGDGKCNIWRSGGVAFAARPRDYTQKVNRKMYQGAMKSILSKLLREERLTVVERFTVEQPKTKLLLSKLKEMQLEKVMIVTDSLDENLYLSARNIPNVSVRDVQAIDPVSLVKYSAIVMTVGAVKQLEERLA